MESIMTIEQQMQVWRDNTPLWDNFPSSNQSAVYVLGYTKEEITRLGNESLQPNGALVVFNSRRNTVRAYCLTDARAARVHKIAMLTDYGRVAWIGDGSLSPSYAYCTGMPEGEMIPDHDAIMYTRDSTVVWNSGIVGYVTDCNPRIVRTPIEDKWIDNVFNRLQQNKFSHDGGSGRYFTIYFPAVTEDNDPEPSPRAVPPAQSPRGQSANIREQLILDLGYDLDLAESAVIEWRNGDYGQTWYINIANGDQYIWDASRGFDKPRPRIDLSPAQVGELMIQLNCFADLVESSFTRDNIADTFYRAEWASLFALQIAKILG